MAAGPGSRAAPLLTLHAPPTHTPHSCVKVFTGHQHTFERLLLRCCWSPDGKRVAAGSADRVVYIWDAETCQLAYALPGHKGSVNDVAFHPKAHGAWGGGGWGRGRGRGRSLLLRARRVTPVMRRRRACGRCRGAPDALPCCLAPPPSAAALQEPIIGSASSDRTIYLGEISTD
jgi:WD40 repeat protein